MTREDRESKPSLWPSGIGSRLGRNRLWVRFLAVSDIYPMFIEPTITWVPSGFSGYIWLDTKIVLKKGPCWLPAQHFSLCTMAHLPHKLLQCAFCCYQTEMACTNYYRRAGAVWLRFAPRDRRVAGSILDSTTFLTNNSGQQATNALVSLFTEQ